MRGNRLNMDEYRKLLILQYLEKKKDSYLLQEIFSKIGLESESGNILIDSMFEEGLIEYKNYLINITKKGKKILKKAPNNSFNINNENIFIHPILPKLKKDDIYIPRKFNLS